MRRMKTQKAKGMKGKTEKKWTVTGKGFAFILKGIFGRHNSGKRENNSRAQSLFR